MWVDIIQSVDSLKRRLNGKEWKEFCLQTVFRLKTATLTLARISSLPAFPVVIVEVGWVIGLTVLHPLQPNNITPWSLLSGSEMEVRTQIRITVLLLL